MVPHGFRPSNAKVRSRVAAPAPAFRETLEFRIVGGNVDFDGDQLVAALAVLRDEASSFETENLARAGAFRDRQHDRALGSWHLYLRPDDGFLESHRQGEAAIGPIPRVETVRRDL